jgi:RNA polymerase sigma-70 factor, ECF subfamily
MKVVNDPLVDRARAGDEEAFRALYRAVQPGLLRYLRGLVGTADADDVASETWLQLVRDLSSFHGDDQAFRAWAAAVGRNRAMDHLRRRQRRPVADAAVDDLDDLPGGDDTAGHALTAVSTDAALALIAKLPADQAEAVLLRVVMGLDARAAGQVLGKRAGAVRTSAHRGLRRLAEMLDGAAGRSEESSADARGASVAGRGVTDPAAPALREMR